MSFAFDHPYNRSVNQQWRIAAHPQGIAKPGDFEYREEDIPEIKDGQVLLRTLYLGLAPLMRMYMQGQSVAGEAPLDIGDVIHGRGVAEVMESRHPDYKKGEIVQGQMGWQTWKASRMTKQEKFYKITEHDLSYAFGVSIFSMTGLSAYGGFFEAGKPRAGETVLVSGSAGGVGSMVVQLAKIAGCRVVGIAGGPEKCAFLKTLGCDAAIDYKNEDVAARILETIPEKIDIYFDNVGGEILEAALENLAMSARVVICGRIATYKTDQEIGPRNYTRLQRVNGSMVGFFVYNYLPIFERSNADFAKWIKDGNFKPVLDIADGFDQMPAALTRLYTGKNVGTQCCRVCPNAKLPEAVK